MSGETRTSSRPLIGGMASCGDPAEREGDADQRDAEGAPRPPALEAPADAQREDRDHGRVDVDDQRRQRRRHGLEARVVRPGVADVQHAEPERDHDAAAVHRPEAAPPLRRGEQPDPGQARPEREPPGREDQPVDPGRRRPAARTASRSRTRRRRPGRGRSRPTGRDVRTTPAEASSRTGAAAGSAGRRRPVPFGPHPAVSDYTWRSDRSDRSRRRPPRPGDPRGAPPRAQPGRTR